MKNGRYEKYGKICWYKDDVLHREDGPAITWVNGTKKWFVDGKLHRTNGPAIEWSDGMKEWWFDGKRHRIDGPAIEWADGHKEWWVDGCEADILAIIGYEPSVPLTEDQQMILRLSV